jgi:Flp pilus assembly protein TadD
MRKFLFLTMAIFMIAVTLTSCRPPELEGAWVDFNAKRYDNALTLALEATEKYPQNSETWFLLGEIYAQKEMYPEMINAYQKSAAIDNKHEQKIEQRYLYYYSVLFNKGVNDYNVFIKEEDKKSEKAIKVIDNAVKNFTFANQIKTDYAAVSLIAASYSLKNDDENTLKHYQQLAEIKPDTADAYILIGDYYFKRQEYQLAIDNMEKALSLEENNADAMTILSQSYDQLGNKEKALELYIKAFELNPAEKAFPFNIGLMYIKKSIKEEISEDEKKTALKASVKYFGEVIKLDAEMKEVYEMKSTSEIQLKDFEGAVKTLKEGIKNLPNEGSLYHNLGVAYANLQKKQKAEDAFAKAKELGYEQ